ncbi:hypothetical protein K7G98_16970 [Saccharothrix sp. MB29]|nr:hypothetical protein [Saccharothrix sp. MB29]
MEDRQAGGRLPQDLARSPTYRFAGVRVADGEIHMLAVDPEHQRGASARLTGYAVEQLRAAKVVLASRAGDPSQAARATYERRASPRSRRSSTKRLDR